MKRLLSILVLVSALAVVLWATTTGPNTPGAFDDVNQWTSVISDYQTDDDTYADTVDCFDAQIDELDTFGFAITNGDDIDGITVVLRAKRDSGAARSRQIAVRLIKAGSPTGEKKILPISPRVRWGIPWAALRTSGRLLGQNRKWKTPDSV